MDIQLSPAIQRFIEAQLQLGVYRSVSEVIESLVEAKTASNVVGDTPALAVKERVAKQREMILQTLDECASLSVAPTTDPFSNRDHDRLLYGERS